MKKFSFFLLLLAAAVVVPAVAQQMPQLPQMPVDTAVRTGKLANGLTYYVRHNALPEQRVNFYIAQKVGSVQEEDNQRGLAHFLEHMCFNGTDHFPGDRIKKYCESIGVMFGVDLNAYTSTDETVYRIENVPVSPANLDSCLLILRDWADGLTLDPAEIDKERGVIHEEWRLSSSAIMRIYERNLPVLYPGSRYGHRMPIGTMEVIDNFKPEELRAYYEKWYRPDLQGIVVVGDIDADAVVARIQQLFGDIKMPANPAAYEHYPVPVTTEPIYVVDKDKEQASSAIQLMYKHDVLPEDLRNTPAFMANKFMMYVVSTALDARFNEMSLQADCPFVNVGTYDDDYLVSKTMGAFSVGILPKPGHDAEAVQYVVQELERAARFGLTSTEIARAREEFMSLIEMTYENRAKQENSYYAPQYTRHFLDGSPIPDITTEYNAYLMLQQLPDEAFNAALQQLVASTDTNFVLLAMYPDKADVVVPTVESLKAAVTAGKSAQLEAYVDNVKSDPLVSQLPAPGKIEKEAPADFGYTCWTLANGARVFFRQTDFDDSSITFRASSFGGENMIADADIHNAKLFSLIMGSTGLGHFTYTELQKKLAGKQAIVGVSLDALTENLSGSSTPKDLRTLFELIYLRFQSPCDDPDAFRNTIAMLRAQLENMEKVPEVAFSDSLYATLYDHNPRQASLTLADLDAADYAAIKRLYSERFRSAGDFDFYFTGNFNPDSLRLYVEQYIAPLEGVKSREKMVDLGIRPVRGQVENRFVRQMETPKAMIAQFWTGEVPYTLKNAAVANALGQILTQRYLKSIREDSGIAYSVGAAGGAAYGVRETYTLQVYCPVQPASCDSAILLMAQGLRDIAQNGVTAEELDKVKKYVQKDFADQQRQNEYWESLVYAKTTWNKDEHTGYVESYDSLTSDDIRSFVNSVLLKDNNCVTITMLPADLKE
ncbi:MAG: insulinase family protein [Bacteroidales bacterium]|nr:insulinase family protein [Bacteroidales bacterium]